MSKIASSDFKPKIFIVFGMPRTGTTYLYHALPRHPVVFVPYRKESHYFSVNYTKGAGWFSSLFEGISDDQIGADINPMYYLDPDSDDRILDYDHNVKVVLGVRDPMDFAISLYKNMLAHGHDVQSIIDVVNDYEWPLTPDSKLRFSLGGGFQRRRINQLRETFGDNLLLYDFRYFGLSPLPILQAIETFVGLPPYFDSDNVLETRINASGRRNLVFLTSLLSDQRVLDAIYAILPDGVIRQARKLFDRLSARSTGDNRGDSPDSAISESERQYLEDYFAEDTAFYEELFSEHPILLGSGKPATAR